MGILGGLLRRRDGTTDPDQSDWKADIRAEKAAAEWRRKAGTDYKERKSRERPGSDFEKFISDSYANHDSANKLWEK